MADIVTIELGFRQQVVAEALKNLLIVSVRSKGRDGSVAVSLFYCDGNRLLTSGRAARIVKGEAIGARALV